MKFRGLTCLCLLMVLGLVALTYGQSADVTGGSGGSAAAGGDAAGGGGAVTTPALAAGPVAVETTVGAAVTEGAGGAGELISSSTSGAESLEMMNFIFVFLSLPLTWAIQNLC